jgi:hypothetical protein
MARNQRRFLDEWLMESEQTTRFELPRKTVAITRPQLPQLRLA